MTIRLILADDHPVLLSGLGLICAAAPDLRVVGKARNSSEMLELLMHSPCDVLLSDYSMPGGSIGDGLGMLSFVRRTFAQVKIIVLTMIKNEALVNEMLRVGVSLVLQKNEHMHHLVKAIEAVHVGEDAMVGASIRTASSNDNEHDDNLLSLSRRELEVLHLYVHGSSVTQIAQQLNRTKQTVSTQKASAMRKMGLERDVDLFRFAYQQGMLQGSDILSGSSLDSRPHIATSPSADLDSVAH